MVHRLLGIPTRKPEVEIYWRHNREGEYIPNKNPEGFVYGASTHVLMDTLKRVGVDEELQIKILHVWLQYQSFYVNENGTLSDINGDELPTSGRGSGLTKKLAKWKAEARQLKMENQM